MYKATVVGGDRRLTVAAQTLKEMGYSITLCGTAQRPQGLPWIADLSACPPGDLLLLPVPLSRDGKTVNGAPHLSLQALQGLCGRYGLVCGGGLSSDLVEAARGGGDAVDLLCDELFVLQNAHLTADAALGILLSQTERAPADTQALVLGYGRIGAALCVRMRQLGFHVAVCARRELSCVEAKLAGAEAVFDSHSLSQALKGRHVLVNTAPVPLCQDEHLLCMAEGAVVLELASGVNFPPVLPQGVRLLRAPGLPGKVYPLSAGALVAAAAHRSLIQKTRTKT